MLLFTLANERQKKQYQHRQGPMEFGRLQQGQCARIVVEDPYTSRDQVRIEELPDGNVRVQTLGSPVTMPDGSQLGAGNAKQFTPPLRIVFGRSTLDIGLIPNEDADQPRSALQTLGKPLASDSGNIKPPSGRLGKAPSADMLAQWFETLLTVQRAAAGSTEFYAETARAVVELVGLDRGLVIVRSENAWDVIANHSKDGKDNKQFSMRVLMQVQTERRTFFQKFDNENVGQSLQGVEALVASPIFDEKEAVIGIVYGSRDMLTAVEGKEGIQPLEAQFVQLLAGAVSAGLTRMAREADAARARVQFEQFFSPELARALECDAGILAANERELTLLFTDLRGFSKISERIGASTYNLLADILDRLTNQVMDHGGVVIDYYGDGLAAMWNAPTDVLQHADRAVEAALAMVNELPAINTQWAERLGGLIRLGVGIHTGRAQVGNSGSRRRLKYGPRGHAVNLTSRVEAATKVFGISCLLTAATQEQLRMKFPLRRVCKARLTGMTEAVDLFELSAASTQPNWPVQRERYEAALALYEKNQVEECQQACQAILRDLGDIDGPTKWLFARAEQRLASSDTAFDPVFSVETK